MHGLDTIVAINELAAERFIAAATKKQAMKTGLFSFTGTVAELRRILAIITA